MIFGENHKKNPIFPFRIELKINSFFLRKKNLHFSIHADWYRIEIKKN